MKKIFCRLCLYVIVFPFRSQESPGRNIFSFFSAKIINFAPRGMLCPYHNANS